MLGLGSNLGDKTGAIEAAIQRLAAAADVLAVAPFYRTAPVGYLDQDWFVNTAATVRVDSTPERFLAILKEIEDALGRRPTFPNGPRRIDLDILLWDDLIRREDQPPPRIPHPRMHLRRFVLAPAADIAPERRHPELELTVAELLARVPQGGVERLD